MASFSTNVLYYILTSSSWKLLTGIFSAIFSYLFSFLHSSETPNASTCSLQILYLILESPWVGFLRDDTDSGGLLSFIVLCSSSVLNFSLDSFLILLELLSALRIENFDRQKEWTEEDRRKDNYRPTNTANILLDIS